ncbi:cytochrome P450 [Setomelanomma holmii]|uniref:Cytochrome P450 n=1 Tax=Setomelanomma holmii TaxID=210430 RepID=A0A9P4LKI6_9PLEO|nr:cytochrome P450 [Setomelanomma holmii]
MPFQRLYVLHTPELIQIIQSKANATTFVPNLLDFGMLFSGLNAESQSILRKAFGKHGNAFTMSVHKYLLSGPSLNTATRTAMDRLSASLPNSFADNRKGAMLGTLRHELTLALTGAIYGPENPDFVPGISHLLYCRFPRITARRALNARGRVIGAFRKYFETGGHLQAFSMVPEMYNLNLRTGLASGETAKMEIATSLAMLSSGANTTFWFLYQIFSDSQALETIRQELTDVFVEDPDGYVPKRKILSLDRIKTHCPNLVAMLNETLRYHGTVTNIKQVQHDTTLADQYLLKKDAIVMIPGRSIHHNKDIWGASADVFDHRRFLASDSKRNLSSTSAFRPFGAGVTTCPGRHFSTNVILSLVAMVVLQYDLVPTTGAWVAPTKRNADLWNAMPKPDQDIEVQFVKRHDEKESQFKFVWREAQDATSIAQEI